jgi:polyisoprenoid-binding protein YceI
MKLSLKSALAVLALSVPSLALGATWDIDPAHSAAQFQVRHLTVSNVRGDFGKVTGTVEWDEKDVTKSTVKATVDVASLDTREPKRDEHLKSADFLDAEKFPNMTFESTKVAKAGPNKLKVTGNLTIKDVTKPVVLDVEGPFKPVTDPWGNTKSGLSATTTIKRQEFNVKWNKTLQNNAAVVGDEVKITLDIELQQKKAEGATTPATSTTK